MKLGDIRAGWGDLSAKAKLMALGTVVLVGASLCLSFGSDGFSDALSERTALKPNSITVEEGVEIPEEAVPIPVASEDTQLVTKLVEVLSHKGCVWLSAEDEVCWLEFTDSGFTEFRGDLTTAATVEFYSIEVIENGRRGTWRVTYDDGSVYDASFLFIQNSASGYYSLTSEAFPTYETYLSKAITSEDVLEW